MIPVSTADHLGMDDVTTSPPSTPGNGQPLGGADAPTREGVLISALRRRGQELFSGTLHVEGAQDGTVTLREGTVIAAATPAAPNLESILLRSGRIGEPDWTEAFAVAAPEGRLPAELVQRGLLGTAGLEVLTQIATVDALFAMTLYGVRACTARPYEPGDVEPPLPADPGLETERLTRELARRQTVAAYWETLGLGVRTRPHRAPAADDGSAADAGPGAVLARVNGRRTARDIAFTLGRTLYSVMNDLALLSRHAKLLFDNPEPAAPDPAPTPGDHAHTALDESAPLPRRPRDDSRINTAPRRNDHPG